MRTIFPVILLVLLPFSAFSQFSITQRHLAFFNNSDSTGISLNVYGAAFFKNNEYFNPLNEGYTLPGSYLQPALSASLSPQIKLSAGATMLQYAGKTGYTRAEPFLRAQFQPTENFQMILGNIFGGVNHKLVEPLYQWERDLTDPFESGLQFLFDKKHWNADVWLDWEQFIQPGDSLQEILTVGISSVYKCLNFESEYQVNIPFQSLFRHHGGQINALDLPIETLANWATGVEISKNPKAGPFKYLGLQLLVIGFNDLSPQKLQEFKQGVAFYPSLKSTAYHFTAELGYFYGKHYLSSLGNKLFHCGKFPDIQNSGDTKSLGTFKLIYSKPVGSTVEISAYFESYIDTPNNFFDYDYGVHLRFNPSFFLWKYR